MVRWKNDVVISNLNKDSSYIVWLKGESANKLHLPSRRLKEKDKQFC